jgi:hypothetical protein
MLLLEKKLICANLAFPVCEPEKYSKAVRILVVVVA